MAWRTDGDRDDRMQGVGCPQYAAPVGRLWVVMLGLDTASLALEAGQCCHTADGPMWLCFTV